MTLALALCLTQASAVAGTPTLAVDDFFATASNTTLFRPAPGVLANDTTGAGALSALKVTDPSHGVLTLNSDGSFTYVPTIGYQGLDSFTYKANDGTADSNTVTVNLRVGGLPLPVGNWTTLLHLGSTASDRIQGFPTSGQSVAWDMMQFAGKGPERIQQPVPGQSVDVLVAATQTPLVWTELTELSGVWGGIGDDYSAYYALYVWSPDIRQVKLAYDENQELRAWMDGQQTPLVFTRTSEANSTTAFTLSAGWHTFIAKFHGNGGGDHLSLRLTDSAGADMNDLRFETNDVIAPNIATTIPANGSTNVQRWQEIQITFSEPMNTAIPAGSVANVTGGSVNGAWSWTDPYILTFTPTGLWDMGAAYMVALNPANATDLSGNQATGQFSFTVAGTVSTPSLTAASPTLVRAVPTQNIAVSGSGFAQGDVIHAAGSVPLAANGHYYYYKYNSMTSWHNSVVVCKSMGGHLATPTDAVEDDFIWRFGGYTNNWFGLTDEVQNGTFAWITGETSAYRNFAPGEPSGGGEDYAIYWWGFQWNDVGDDPAAMRPYVCEFDSLTPPSVKFVNGAAQIVATNVRYNSTGSLTLNADFTGAADGDWNAVLTNPDGGTSTLVAAVKVDGTAPHVTAISPADNATPLSAPVTIDVTLDEPLDPATVSTDTVRLKRAGPDGILGTADDIQIVPVSVVLLTPTQIRMDLTGLSLPNDEYGVSLGNIDNSTNLEAHWKFDENAGATTADSSGHGLNGTLHGPAWSPGKIASALEISDANSFVDFGGGDLGPPWTVALWVKRKDSPYVSSNMLCSDNNYLKLEQYPNLKKVGFTKTYVADYAFNYEAPVGDWVHLTFMGTNTSTSLYVNGVFQDTVAVGIAAPMKRLGANNDSVQGTMDDIRVYSRNLSTQEIASFYHGQIADLAGNALSGLVFTSKFTIATRLQVSAMNPAPNIAFTQPLSEVTVSFNRSLDPATVNASTFLLTGRGPDGQFDTADDLLVAATSISVQNNNTIKFDLSGMTLVPDLYRVKIVSGGLADTLGNVLDGEFSGAFLSGDGTAGGDFVTTFSLGKQDQNIDFQPLTAKTYGDPPFTLLAQASPSGLPVRFLVYSGPASITNSTLTINGAGTVKVMAVQDGDEYWNEAPFQIQSFNVAQLDATPVLSGPPRVYDGTPQPAVITTTPPGLTVTITYNGVSTPPKEPGPYFVAVTVSEQNYFGATSGILTIDKIAAGIVFDGLAATFDGTPKPVAVTTIPPGLAVAVTYNGSVNPFTAAGDYLIEATVSDSHYAADKSALQSIGKVNATVTFGNLSQTFDGAAKSATVATNPAGLNVSLTYNGSATPPVDAGNYAVLATVTDSNYQGMASEILIVSEAGATLTLGKLTQTFDGTAKSATVVTSPGNLAVNLTYDGSAIPPVNAGSYSIVATVTEANYTGAASGILTIAKANATLTLGNLLQTFDGTAKSATVLTSPGNLAVDLTYDGSAILPVNAGSYAIVATVTDAHYTGTASGILTIAKAGATLTLGNLIQNFDGLAKSASGATTPDGLSVSLTYDGSANPPVAAGSYWVSAAVTDANYQGSTGGVLTIIQPNRAPVAAASASPLTGHVPLAVSFSGTGSDADSEALSFAWNFGDGSAASSLQNPAHTFAVAGTYVITLTVSDGHGGSAGANVIVVAAAGGGAVAGDLDSDGDGFSDEIEAKMGSSILDSTDTPMGMSSPQETGVIFDTKLSIKLNFIRAGNDSLTMTGSVPLPAGSVLDGQQVLLDIGGVTKAFKLSANGKSNAGTGAFSVKSPSGKFNVTLLRGDLGGTLAKYGLQNLTLSQSVTVPVTIIFENTLFTKAVLLQYQAVKGKRGAAK